VIVIHASLLAAVQLQPAAAVTDTNPVPPFAEKLWLTGEIVRLAMTVMLNEQFEVLFAASVAVQVTVVVPDGKTKPAAGEHMTLEPGQSSFATGTA
jgi:hypothetical protein